MEEIIVNDDIKKRIDAYLAEKTDYSRVTIQRLIEEEKIKVNGKKTKSSYKVQLADKIQIEKEQAKETRFKSTANTIRYSI